MGMKKMYCLGFLLTLVLSFSICIAENCGYQPYRKEIVSSTEYNGYVEMEKTKVLGILQVNGGLKANDSLIKTLLVNGQVDLNNCVIVGATSINGFLNARKTTFEKELSIASEKIVLNMCSVNSLTVQKVNGYTGTQVIDLRGGTNITGTIAVVSGKGEIWVTSGSDILSSQVSGAQIYIK